MVPDGARRGQGTHRCERGREAQQNVAGPAMTLTIGDVLALPELRRGVPEVLVGADRLERAVRWVHTAEAVDIASLLRGGELLLTAGMGIGTTAEQQDAAATALAERGVAALVLELGTVFADPPDGLVAGCTRAALPLIVLHRVVPFIAITEAVHREIVSARLGAMRRNEELQRVLTELLLRDAAAAELLDAVADALGGSVLLHRPGGEVVAIATRGEPRADVLALWEMARRELPGAPVALEHQVPTGDLRVPGPALTLLASEADDAQDLMLADAARLLGLALRRDHEDAPFARERGALLDDVRRGVLAEADAAERAAGLGFAAPVLLPLLIDRRAQRVGRLTAAEDAGWVRVWREVRRALTAQRSCTLVGDGGDPTVVVVGLADEDERTAATERVVALVRSAVARELGSADAAVICVCAPTRAWAAIGPLVERGTAELPAAALVRGPAWHDLEAADLDRLIAGLHDTAPMRAFERTRLAPVIEHDAQRQGAPLLPTLEAYCRSGGRKTAAARELRLDRATLYRRVVRLEQLLGASLDDPATRLGVQVALLARRYAGADRHDPDGGAGPH